MTDRPAGTLPRSLLILTGFEDGPFRYRVKNFVEELRLLGVPATVLFHHDQNALQAAAEHELVIFQRVPGDEYVERLVARARSAAALTVFGIDDLLFEPDRLPRFVGDLPREERPAWVAVARSYRRTFELCDAFVGATEVLARTASALGKPAFVHRNALSQELIDLSTAAKATRRPGGAPRIGYYSGTRTHARDFATIATSLANVLGARPEVRMELVGPLELPAALRPFAARIDRKPVVPWRELPALVAQVDVNVVPLELDDLFCHAKSELKWFEAAVAGVATIASPTEPYLHAIRDGETGMLAKGPQEWEARLLALLDDPSLRARLAGAAFTDAVTRYGPAASANRLSAMLRGLMERRPPTPLRPGPLIPPGQLASFKAAGFGIGSPAVEPAGSVPGPQQLATRQASEGIQGAHGARQSFTCPPGILHRIDLLVGTHRRFNGHDVLLRILDPSGAQLAIAAAYAGDACDNAWFAFDLEPPLELASETGLTLVVEAPMALPGEGLGIWYEPSETGRGSVGEKAGLDLAFRTWLRTPGWKRETPAEDRVVDGAAGPEAIRRLLEELQREKEARRELERRLVRVEERAAAAQHDARRQSPAPPFATLRRLRGTLPYRAARRIYRMLKR